MIGPPIIPLSRNHTVSERYTLTRFVVVTLMAFVVRSAEGEDRFESLREGIANIGKRRKCRPVINADYESFTKITR